MSLCQYLIAFLCAFVFRYLRLVVNCIAFWTYQSTPPLDAERRSKSAQDVTVIVPTLDGDSQQIRETIRSVLANEPYEIILVTIDQNYGRALELCASMKTNKIRVFSNLQANKRLQMLRGLLEVSTSLTTFSDDDVFWKPNTLAWMLSPFEDSEVGATGTCQRLRRVQGASMSMRFWNFLAALYLERRNFDCASCNAIDGGLPCLSGRTATYRTDILQDEDFQWAFNHEMWMGQKLNAADDDNFLTRWMVSHGWKIKMQYSDDCEIETTLEDNSKFLLQCLRWSRSNWRSNLTSMFVEGHVWRLQPWSTYSVFLTTITAWALPWDILLAVLCYKATETSEPPVRVLSLCLLLAWWIFARIVKLLGHFRRFPADILLLPLSIAFGYFHSLAIKPYALYTLDEANNVGITIERRHRRRGADDEAAIVLELNLATQAESIIGIHKSDFDDRMRVMTRHPSSGTVQDPSCRRPSTCPNPPIHLGLTAYCDTPTAPCLHPD